MFNLPRKRGVGREPAHRAAGSTHLSRWTSISQGLLRTRCTNAGIAALSALSDVRWKWVVWWVIFFYILYTAPTESGPDWGPE